MSLDNVNTVDAVGTDQGSGELVLSIIDDWDWSEERAHLLALQAKLNAYFAFVETGQIAELEPAWRTNVARIDVIFGHSPPDAAVALLRTAEFVGQQLQLRISYQTYSGRSE